MDSRKSRCLFVLVIVVVSERASSPSEDVQPKIVMGREAIDGEFPWMVALHFRDEYFCSAFFISPTLVMTAAHCVHLEDGLHPADEFYGMTGSVRREGPGVRIDFSEVTTHPDYAAGDGGADDIAVFRTTRPTNISHGIQSICLAEAGQDFQNGNVQAMGWGWTATHAEKPPLVLQTIDLRLQWRALCQLFFSFFLVPISIRHICATSVSGPGGVCFGDSGGPLVFPQATGRPVSIGVAAFITAFGCGPPFLPNVYTATASYTHWIREVAGKDASSLCFI